MPPAARLAVWTTAWLRGDVSFDDVADAMSRDGARHRVIGLPGALAAVHATTHRPGTPAPTGSPASGAESHRSGDPLSASESPEITGSMGATEAPGAAESVGATEALGAALIAWRRVTAHTRLILAVPGDVRGLPAAAAFSRAATEAGQAVLGGPLGLVPVRSAPTASSAPPIVLWSAFAVEAPRPDHQQLSEAEYELAVAMRETATLFTAADLSGGRADVGAALTRARGAGERVDLPPGYPARAVALAAQSERLAAILTIAEGDSRGGAVDRDGMSRRDEALRAMTGTVRRARQAAYNAYLAPTA